MPAPSPKCPKCAGAMEEGYILELGHANVKAVEQWVAGPPKSGYFFGVDTSGRKVKRITTWRCTGCGFLESFAK